MEWIPYVRAARRSLIGAGKVCDIWPANTRGRIPVAAHMAADAFSSHDVLHLGNVPMKGYIRTAFKVFWHLRMREAGIQDDVIAFGNEIWKYKPRRNAPWPADAHLRTVIVRKLEIYPQVEMITRHNLVGKGTLYRDFYSQGILDPWGLNLKPGLPIMAPLPACFTPTTKIEKRDRELDYRSIQKCWPEADRVRAKFDEWLRDYFERVLKLRLCDHKIEVFYDRQTGTFWLGDEYGSLDCIRAAEIDTITLGKDPDFIDKQKERDAVVEYCGGKPTKPVDLPESMRQMFAEHNLKGFARITGMSLEEFQKRYLF